MGIAGLTLWLLAAPVSAQVMIVASNSSLLLVIAFMARKFITEPLGKLFSSPPQQRDRDGRLFQIVGIPHHRQRHCQAALTVKNRNAERIDRFVVDTRQNIAVNGCDSSDARFLDGLSDKVFPQWLHAQRGELPLQ